MGACRALPSLCQFLFTATLSTFCLTACARQHSNRHRHASALAEDGPNLVLSSDYRSPRVALAVQGKKTDADKWIALTLEMRSNESVSLFFLTYDEPATCPPGIFCYHFPKTTWSEGRNELARKIFQEEEETGQTFKYWSFHDTDTIGLDCWICRHTRTTNSRNACCYDQYIYFLLGPQNFATVSPGHPGDHEQLNVAQSPAAVARIDCHDAMKHAFHREAVPVILPYIDDLDNVSWWLSQALQFQVTAGCLSGYNAVLGGFLDESLVQEHTPYPHGLDFPATFKAIEAVYGGAGLMPWPIKGEDLPQGNCTMLSAPRHLVTDLASDSGKWMASDAFLKCRDGLKSRFDKFMRPGSGADDLS